jgi:hypothetical protein
MDGAPVRLGVRCWRKIVGEKIVGENIQEISKGLGYNERSL